MVEILFTGADHYGLRQIRLVPEESQELPQRLAIEIYQFIHHDPVAPTPEPEPEESEPEESEPEGEGE